MADFSEARSAGELNSVVPPREFSVTRNNLTDFRSDKARRRVRHDPSNDAKNVVHRRDAYLLSPHLSLRARRRNPDGSELAVDVAARGWSAIVGVALLALVTGYVLLRWLL